MAHLDKFSRGQVGGITRHFERHKRENGEYIRFGNQEIDTEKSHLNYNLADEQNQLNFIKKRTSEVRCLNRKDVNVMASWVITLPESIKTSEEQQKFFREAYLFLEKKYGKENVVSAYVHLDETTPHMHFAFVPVVEDKKKGDLKVSANDLITRNHLRDFHPELENHMKKVFGREVGILNEKTKDGNKAVEELKRNSALEALERLRSDLKALKEELAMIDIAKDEIRRLERIEAKEKFFKKDHVEIPKKTFEQFINLAKNYRKDTVGFRKSNAALNDKVKHLEKTIEGLIEKQKENVRRIGLDELRERAEARNTIMKLETKLNQMTNFLIKEGLVEKFSQSLEKKEIQKSRTNERGFSR